MSLCRDGFPICPPPPLNPLRLSRIHQLRCLAFPTTLSDVWLGFSGEDKRWVMLVFGYAVFALELNCLNVYHLRVFRLRKLTLCNLVGLPCTSSGLLTFTPSDKTGHHCQKTQMLGARSSIRFWLIPWFAIWAFHLQKSLQLSVYRIPLI